MKYLYLILLVALSACITKKGISVTANSTGKIVERSKLVQNTNGIYVFPKVEAPKIGPIKPPTVKVVPLKEEPKQEKPETLIAKPNVNTKEAPSSLANPQETKPQKLPPQYVLPNPGELNSEPEGPSKIDLEVSKLIELNNKSGKQATFADLISFYFAGVMTLLTIFLMYHLHKNKKKYLKTNKTKKSNL